MESLQKVFRIKKKIEETQNQTLGITMPRPNIREILGLEDFNRQGGIWKALLAEFLGCALLNLFGCASCLKVKDETVSFVMIALTFGLVIMAVVQAIGHVSGGHVNPAVTCAMLVTGHIPVLKGLSYIVVQCLGSISGTAILKAMTPSEIHNTLGLTQVSPALTPVQGFGFEFFLGFILIFVVFGICDLHRPESKPTAALIIGLTVSLGHLFGLRYTGASMNPARTLGSAVLSNIWENHWVYWIGPILGGVCAGLLYQHALSARPCDSGEYTPVQLKRLDKKEDTNA